MSRRRAQFRPQFLALVLLPLAGCVYDPPPGTNIGALRQPDPDPPIPTDTTTLDFRAAVEEALALAGTATLASGWDGHMAALTNATSDCPTMWVGALPDEFDVDVDEDNPGFSFAADCLAPISGATFSGFSHWTTALGETSGARTLLADLRVTAGNGAVLYALDGEAADAFDQSTGEYGSSLDGELSGTLVNAQGPIRTGGDFSVSWGPGTLNIAGTLTVDGGFGPSDNRDPATSPELEDVGFTPGMPRFTSVAFDLQLGGECASEPRGYLGLRGNEGYWFDVYFLPLYDAEEDVSSASAFPFEEIDNVTCDGVGTLFARNVSLADLDAELTTWSREVAPDFAGVVGALPTPTLDAYIYTLHTLPQE